MIKYLDITRKYQTVQQENKKLKLKNQELTKINSGIENVNTQLIDNKNYLYSQNRFLQRHITDLLSDKINIIPKIHKDYYGIHLNYPINKFKDFKLVYSNPYSHNTTTTELTTIRDSNQGKLVCVGARYKDAEELSLVACGDIEQVFTQTLGSAHLYEGVWWYMWNEHSFGFSFVKEIKLEDADGLDTPNGNMRLSWHLDKNIGGWRAGEFEGLDLNNEWYKIIYVY